MKQFLSILILLAAFCLLPAQNSPLTLTAPNGGEVWSTGSTHAITWTQTNLAGNVSITLIRDNPASPGTIMIAPAVPVGAQSYNWTIPPNVMPGTNYLVRIHLMHTGVNLFDVSDAPFTIEGGTPPPPVPSITVITPNGGEVWAAGSTYDITWGYSNLEGDVRITLVQSNNAPQIVITETVPIAAGTYAWTIPATIQPGMYKVHIVWLSVTTVYFGDLSDGFFEITGNAPPPPVPTLTLTAPNGGEIWQAGTAQAITWTFDGNQGFVRLQLLGGPNMAPLRPIALRVPAAAESFNWHIPRHLLPSDSYRVRIILLTNANVPVQDMSDADFTISAPTADSTLITVTAPNGGEAWAKNSVQTITWTATEYTGNVRIFLVRGANQFFRRRLIVPEAPNTGTWEWTIPPLVPTGDNYYIVVKKIGAPGMDISDASFSIIDVPVNVKVSPNPTRQGTQISFEVKTPVTASVRVYNIKGQLVRSLAENKLMSGTNNFRWDGNDSQGRKAAAGIYFVRVSAPDFNATRKIIILK